jgi:hypothetical protein
VLASTKGLGELMPRVIPHIFIFHMFYHVKTSQSIDWGKRIGARLPHFKKNGMIGSTAMKIFSLKNLL